MKGGKAGRKRKGRSVPTGKTPGPAPAKAKNKSTHRTASVAPKKGSRKNTEFGWSSTTGDD
jgi:hypothetical protein